MKTECQQVRLGDAPLEIIDGDRGNNYPSQSEFFETGFCLFLNAKNVRINGFDFSECMFISKEKDELLRKGKLQRNDVILTTRGTVGNVAFYSESVPFDVVRINSGMVIIRPNSAELLPEFCFYIFKKLQEDFITFTTGSAQPQLPIKDLSKMEIPLPPLPVQRTIAATLSCLDDKIELNNRINANLEAQAQAVFKSWFVDFEPFQGGEFVDSELGKIPKGWRVGTLGEYCKITTGKLDANARKENGKYRFYTCAKDYYLIDDYAFDTEAILVSGNGEYVGYINYYKGKFNAYQRTYVIDDFKISVAYIKCFLQLFLKDRIINERRGSSTPYIVLGTLADFEMVIPPKEVLDKYNNVAFNLLKQAENNKEESHTLAAIRDILLPRLMSGEIEVEDAL